MTNMNEKVKDFSNMIKSVLVVVKTMNKVTNLADKVDLL